MSDDRPDEHAASPEREREAEVARGATGGDASDPEGTAPVGPAPVADAPTGEPDDESLRDGTVGGRDVIDAMDVDPESTDGGARDEVGATGDSRSREELLAALDEAERERDEYLDALRRTQAEFSNYRKRSMREGAEQRQQGIAEVLSRLADVVDDFELAVLAGENAQDVTSLRRGVEMVYGKLLDSLRSFGLERIAEEGVPFDPERHDAVQKASGEEEGGEPSPDGEPVVVEVLRPGYAVGDRVVRAAMVKVRS